jgi:RNA polymerase sigma-70 factor (ECF subfamily)
VSSSLTDAELVTLAISGDEDAFGDLMDRHARHLRKLVMRRLRNPQDVMDVLQETHLSIWRSLLSYDAGRPFEAWLTCIALNKCRDWARRKHVRRGALARLQEEVVHERGYFGTPSAECIVIDWEGVRDLDRALRELPPQLREPLVLSALSNLPQATVARELKLTKKAVEMRIRRARLRLQEALARVPEHVNGLLTAR